MVKKFFAYLRYLISIDVIKVSYSSTSYGSGCLVVELPFLYFSSDRFGCLANQSQHLVTMYSLRNLLPRVSRLSYDKSVPLLPGLLHKYHVRLCLTRQILHDDASLLLLSITRSVVTLAASLMRDRAVAFMLFVVLGLQ